MASAVGRRGARNACSHMPLRCRPNMPLLSEATGACSPTISRRCARNRRPTCRQWTAMPCAPPMSTHASVRLKSDRRGRGRPAVCAGARRRTKQRGFSPAACCRRRRHDRHPGTSPSATAITSNRKGRRKGPPHPRAGPGLQGRRRNARRRTPAHHARSRARRRHEPSARARAPAAEGCAVCDRRRTGAGRYASRQPGQIVSSNSLRSAALARAEGATVDDFGIVGDRLDDTIAAVAARASERRRHSRHRGRRVGRRIRPGPEGLHRRRHGTRHSGNWRLRPGRPLMHGRLGDHARARRPRQSGLGVRLLLFCSWCR